MNDYIKIDFAYKLNLSSETIRKFYKKNWSDDIILGDEKFFKWNFINNPFNSNKNYNCVAVSKSDEILGVMGLSLRDFFLNKKKIKAAELTTWVINEKERGKSIGKKILNFLKCNFDLLIGSGITNNAKNVYLLNEFKYIKNFPRFFKIYDTNNMNPFIKFDKIGEKRLNNQKLCNFRNIAKVNKLINFKVIDNLNNIQKLDSNLFTKSNKWFNWRFNRHPYFNYFSYEINYKNFKAVYVLRFDEVSKVKVCYLVDVFGDIEAIKFLPEILDNKVKELKINVIEFYSTNSKINAIFISNDWISTIDDESIKFMNRLYPPKWVEPATTSLIIWSRRMKDEIYNFPKLYLNKADLDLDRPSLSSLKTKKLK